MGSAELNAGVALQSHPRCLSLHHRSVSSHSLDGVLIAVLLYMDHWLPHENKFNMNFANLATF